MSTSSRQLSLAATARSLAALAETGESAPQTPTEDVALPGGVYTPTGDAPTGPLPHREMIVNICSSPSDATLLGIPYQFTLVDLNARSYYLVHEVPDTPARTQSQSVNHLRDAIRQAVLLANIEVCLIRNWQIAGRPGTPAAASATVDLTIPSPAEPPAPAAELKRHAEENDRALAPVASILSKWLHCCGRRELDRLLEDRLQCAQRLLQEPGISDELVRVEEAVLQEMAFTFAAYQPAVLDEDVKGSQSPCDPRSHTRAIGDVAALVERSATEAGTDAPEKLAALAVRLLEAVRRRKPNSPMAGWMLQAACMSGHSELVCKLLDRRRSASCSGLFELDIIRRLRNAWLGYQRYRPLQPGVRNGVKAQSMDWLDFKCSCARAVLIAHKVIETLLLRDDKDLTQSVQMAAAAEHAADPPLAPTLDPSFSLAAEYGVPAATEPAAVAEATTPQEAKPETDRERRVVLVEASSSPHRPAAAAAPAGATPHKLLDDTSEEMELEPTKWGLVRELFPRAAACKPLALAMLHVVLAGKRDVLRKAREAAACGGGGGSTSGAIELPLPPTPGAAAAAAADPAGSGGMHEEEDADMAAAAEAEAARQEEEARSSRYRRLHLLAVQAAHLAVHSGSLSTVSDAVAVVRAVRAWPALDLVMLNDLAQVFPHQCASLLEAVPLQEVDLEDNVLPFALPVGFITVAVSDKDAHEFRQGGGTGSTQDAAHFATQREADASIEASLLALGRSWLGLLFLFWPSEFASPTTRQMVRVLRCALAAFARQGPGSCAVAVLSSVLLLVAGIASRAVVTVVRILYFGVLRRMWSFVATYFPAVRRLAYRIGGRPAAVGPMTHMATGLSVRTTTLRQRPSGGAPVPAPAAGEGEAGSDDDEDDGFTRQLGLGIWRTFFAHGHNTLIDGAVGWGRGSASISCRKVPMPMSYASQSSGMPGGRVGQLDTALLEKLLSAPGLHPAVFGSRVLRALILFKWNYFTKYFIILQLLLHITYMCVFLAYAFSIKDMEPVDGRASGPGAHTPGCQLQAPSPSQTGMLVVLAVMTVDFLVQELRQIRHFGLRFFAHTWDLLDVSSVALVMASVTLHFSCSSGVSPITLRGLAAVQIVLLFMRLLYYAMASDKLGSFVRMVLETTYDLSMFFAFLAVVFVGFALAIIISQGSLADEEQTFIKLFTMMYGDFDVNFLSTLESGALGLDALTRVLASVYMILVTIILLNLLISVISESYERIRENEKWESLRNKAVLIVESETQLFQSFLTWLYTTLTPASSATAAGDAGPAASGRRYLYIIAPEYARRTEADGDDEDDEDDEDGDEDEDDDGQWNGRLGEMKRHITTQSRATLDALRKEMSKVLVTMESVGAAATAVAAAAATSAALSTAEAAPEAEAEVADGEGAVGGSAAREASGSGGHANLATGSAPVLNERAVQILAAQVGSLVSKEIDALRKELLAEIAKAGQHPQQHPQQQPQQQLQQQQQLGPSGRLSPLTSAGPALASLPPLMVGLGAAGPASEGPDTAKSQLDAHGDADGAAARTTPKSPKSTKSTKAASSRRPTGA